jgi:hypothetical protein
MPKPIVTPCGGEGQPACPPTPATPVNLGDVVVIDGQNYVVANEDEQGEDVDVQQQ